MNSKYLWFLTLFFSMMTILNNWFYPYSMFISNITLNAGLVLIAPTFFITALITEVYSYKFAYQMIWGGFLFQFFLMAYAHMIIHMPNPDYPTHNDLFNAVLTPNGKIFFASTVSYFCSQLANLFIFTKLNFKRVCFRFFYSSFISIIIAHVVFSFLIHEKIIESNLFSSFFILFMEIPLFYYLVNKLKRIEKLDLL